MSESELSNLPPSSEVAQTENPFTAATNAPGTRTEKHAVTVEFTETFNRSFDKLAQEVLAEIRSRGLKL
jgi:hypothetical protein